MIRFTLKCAKGHQFDSWFASSSAFETLRARGQLSCAHCGSAEVSKSLMAPSLSHGATTQHGTAAQEPERPLSEPTTPEEAAIDKLRAEVEANSENVGLRFAEEARAIHDGDSPARAIHGEARPNEARKLLEDGVPVLPLPFKPRNRTN